MAAEWYYQIMGQQLGPISPTELRALASTGAVTPETIVKKGVDGVWLRAERVQGFFEWSDSRPTLAVYHVEEKPISRTAASSTEKELRAPPSPPPLPPPPQKSSTERNGLSKRHGQTFTVV